MLVFNAITVAPRLIGPIRMEDFLLLSQDNLQTKDEITLETIIWNLKMLTFIDGEPLKAGLLLRGSTVF